MFYNFGFQTHLWDSQSAWEGGLLYKEDLHLRLSDIQEY